MAWYDRAIIWRLGLIVPALLLAYWQFDLVTAESKRPINAGLRTQSLNVTLNSGRVVSLPDTTKEYTVVVIWKLESKWSLWQIEEAEILRARADVDSLATFYYVNLEDSLPKLRAAVDFDNSDIPFAIAPEGQLMEEYSFPYLPTTIFITRRGRVENVIEGFQPENLSEAIENLIRLRKLVRSPGLRID